MSLLLVGLGAAVGAPLRYLLGQHLDGRWWQRWHHGTLLANSLASALLGACAGWSLDGSSFALVGTGFCGALSTYSSLATQSRDLGWARGTVYALATITLGLAACALGFVAASGS